MLMKTHKSLAREKLRKQSQRVDIRSLNKNREPWLRTNID